jgi:MFS transporter, MHS family, proline/betaine transporter
VTKKIVNLAGGGIGNLLEWYDFLVYGFLATFLAPLFWSSSSITSSFEYALGVFAISYLARPIGGVFFGHFADRFGRKIVLIISTILIGSMTVLIGCLPTYQQIGIWAPVLLLLFRFLQGLSVGGEYMNSAIYLVEHAPSQRRGLFGSFTNVCGGLGSALASVIVWLIVAQFSSLAISAWAWRLPFLFGIFNLILSLSLRLKMEETPVFLKLKTRVNNLADSYPLIEAFKQQRKEMVKVIGIVSLQGISFYTLTVFFTFWMIRSKALPVTTTFISTTIALLVNLCSSLLGGYLSDKFGRKILLLVGICGMGVSIIPIFDLLASIRGPEDAFKLYAAQIVLATFFGIYNGVLPAALVELFAARTRCSALSVSYNCTAGIFGGTAPLISLYLVDLTHSDLAPAFYLLASAVLAGITVIFWLKEAFRSPLPN